MAAEYPHPLTQTSEQSPNIFVCPSGFPISVYLDVNPEIFGRPRLIRLLRTSGADISHSPADASIILINSETESGLKFVHDWSADTHKTVLNYGWIQACLRSGHALLEADNWGGFRVLHTGDCMYSDDDEMEDDTPATLKGRQSEPSQSAMRPRAPSPVSRGRHARPNGPNRRPSNPLPARSSYQLVSPIVTGPPPNSAVGTSSQNTPTHIQPTPASSNHTLPSSAPSQQSSMPQSHIFSRANVISPSTSLPPQVPGLHAPQMFPLATNQPDPQQSDPLNLLHALNSAYQFQNAASQTLTQLVETIIVVAQRQGVDTAVIQNYLATLPMPSSLHHSSSSLAPQSLQAHSPTSHSSSEKPVAPVSDLPPKNVDQSPSSVPTTRRPVSHESPPPVKRRKKLTEPPQVKKATPHQQQNPPEPVSPRPTKGIFTTKNGQPILVFVQVDTRGRHEFVHLIKKNGGQITADIPRAGFVILNPRSVSYADLRREAEDSGRTIVQTTFITESIREGHLMNPNDYSLEDNRVKKVARVVRRTTSFRNKQSPESDHESSEAQTSDTVVDTLSPVLAREHERSTTPEPPMAVQLKNGYKFTPAEMSYTWMLLRRIIAKVPGATKQTVAKALCEKMPHHSEASWMNTLGRHKDMYEAIKTEVLDSVSGPEAHLPNPQQHQDASAAEMNEVDRAVDELDELQVGASLIPAEAEPMHEDEQQSLIKKEENKEEILSYARDFEALVEFLTSSDAEGGEEDEIFERLRAKHICASAPSWSEFLEHHAAAVTEEVERRYAAQHST